MFLNPTTNQDILTFMIITILDSPLYETFFVLKKYNAMNFAENTLLAHSCKVVYSNFKLFKKDCLDVRTNDLLL